MSSTKFLFKAVTVILITSIFFTACDVPDISKFTEQSAEMTRGIRKGVKDTGDILVLASERADLIQNAEKRKQFLDEAKKFQAVMKPTLSTLDALDAYLEALGTLSQANKKAGENAKAVVDSVGGLVTAVSGITLADTGLKIATGLLTLAEQFRTARSFKKRVNKAAEIVEGRFLKKVTYTEENGKVKEDVEFIKKCTDDKKDLIEQATIELNAKIKAIEADDALSNKEKIDQIKAAKKATDEKVYEYGCGVIDLLKFTMKDLQKINKAVMPLLITNLRENHRVTTNFHDSIVENDTTTQRELTAILRYKNLLSLIKEDEYNGVDNTVIVKKKRRAKENLENLFMLDPRMRVDVLDEIREKEQEKKKELQCTSQDPSKPECMEDLVSFRCKDGEDLDTCDMRLDQLIMRIGTVKFDEGNGYIEPVLADRAKTLYEENEMYLAEKERIKPDYSSVTNEITGMENRQIQLHKLLNASIDALDVWAKTHANLRVAVNTDKTLTVSALAAKVKEIWAIIESEETE